MIYKRVAARLKAQDWLAITIELGIVVVGVFIGTQVSNWNAGRLEKVESQRMLAQLKPNLQSLTDYYESARVYYATTRRYATTAFAGWRGDPKVSDQDFVIAAYQASQVLGLGTNGSTWATVLGADQLRGIDNLAIRNDLSFLMSADYTQFDIPAVNTPYRPGVRRLIPVDIQDAIRAQCGDYPDPRKPLFFTLPPTCNLKIAADAAAKAAVILRGHPELAEDLQWHMAAQAALLTNLIPYENITVDLNRRIAHIKE
ncbi:hypothetical protein [Sphingomonas sp.]|uniref:hypothetical protein n=1 Tax=Sphingomonas sp. TaxID=28214 RepID=UPI00286BA0C2|nr:hypothetical protein [Sphingomonas sp.]